MSPAFLNVFQKAFQTLLAGKRRVCIEQLPFLFLERQDVCWQLGVADLVEANAVPMTRLL